MLHKFKSLLWRRGHQISSLPRLLKRGYRRGPDFCLWALPGTWWKVGGPPTTVATCAFSSFSNIQTKVSCRHFPPLSITFNHSPLYFPILPAPSFFLSIFEQNVQSVAWVSGTEGGELELILLPVPSGQNAQCGSGAFPLWNLHASPRGMCSVADTG